MRGCRQGRRHVCFIEVLGLELSRHQLIVVPGTTELSSLFTSCREICEYLSHPQIFCKNKKVVQIYPFWSVFLQYHFADKWLQFCHMVAYIYFSQATIVNSSQNWLAPSKTVRNGCSSCRVLVLHCTQSYVFTTRGNWKFPFSALQCSGLLFSLWIWKNRNIRFSIGLSVQSDKKLHCIEWDRSILVNINVFLSIPFAWSHELVPCKFWGIIIYIGVYGFCVRHFLTWFATHTYYYFIM